MPIVKNRTGAALPAGDTVYVFKSGYRFVKAADDLAYLLGPTNAHVFATRIWVAVLDEISKGFDIGSIDVRFSDSSDHPMVYYCLKKLVGEQLIIATQSQQPSWTLWEDIASAKRRRIQDSIFVNLYSIVPMYADYFKHALEQIGLVCKAPQHGSPVHFIVCQDYLDPQVKQYVASLRHHRESFFLMRIAENRLWLGPLIQSDRGPCSVCLWHQLERNRPVERYLEKLGRRIPYGGKETDVTDPTFRSAVGLGVTDFVRRLLEIDADPQRLQAIKILRLDSLQSEEHMVSMRPQCPVCGDPSLFETQVSAPVVLEDRAARYDREGGVRSRRPEETWERYRHLVDPITGVVAHLGPYIGKDHPLRPVYYSTYYSVPPPSAVSPKELFTRNSFGKGTSPAQAKVSALCESLERYSAMHQGDEPVVRGCFLDLTPEAIHPRALCNFSDAQYEDARLAKIDCSRQAVPPRCRDDMAIDWTPAWSLSSGCRRLLPATFCYTNHPASAKEQVCPQNSNGHAAGNCLEEAILQGFFELVERDAAAIWWYNRLRFPTIDLAGFGDTYFQDVQHHYDVLGWDLWCLDITSDLKIPVIVALARHRQSRDYCVGMGCHLIGRLAIQRALTEIHQVFDPMHEQPPVWNEADIEEPQFLMPNYDISPMRASAYDVLCEAALEGRDIASFRAYIEHSLETLSRVGLEMIVLNQTRPDVGLSCVKVVVPGLRHMWRRLGPGRLYEVPVKMGWREVPLLESALNPKPLLL